MKPAKIVLYGHFGSGNIGNDSSLEAALVNIRGLAPNTSIVCVCNGPDVISARFGIETLPIDAFRTQEVKQAPRPSWVRLFSKLRRLIRECKFVARTARWFGPSDMFVVVGTGAVDDMAVRRPWDAPLDLYKWCRAAKLAGSKVVFLSVGVGPIVNKLSRRLMFRALRLADRRTYRETSAVEYLERHGFATGSDRLTPDLVFSVQVDAHARRESSAPRRLQVGLGLINYHGWKHDEQTGAPIYRAYMEKIKVFLRWLLEQGFDVRLLVGDATDGPCVNEILAFMDSDDMRGYATHVHATNIQTLQTLLQQLAETDIVVASRFHNVLCALLLERPVVSLGYHVKNDLLMASVGLDEFCQHIETFSTERLVEHVIACRDRRGQIAAALVNHVAGFRCALEHEYRDLMQFWRQA